MRTSVFNMHDVSWWRDLNSALVLRKAQSVTFISRSLVLVNCGAVKGGALTDRIQVLTQEIYLKGSYC